jgi:hypothetical protein
MERIMAIRTVIGAIGILAASSALASPQTWDFKNSGDTTLSGSGYGNTIDFTRNDGEGDIALTVSAWSETINTSDFCSDFPSDPSCNDTGSTGSTERDPYIDTAQLVYYGDTLGIQNQDGEGGAPQHSIDNIPNSSSTGYNDYDMVLLEFDEAITLTNVVIGWATNNGNNSNNGSADISVVAYTGNSAITSTPFFAQTETWGSLLSSGWESIGNYENASQTQAITTDVVSNYWLVGAYNPIFGGGLSNANDGFKLAAVETERGSRPPPSTQISEPGSFAIMLLGLVGLGLRRKSAKTA